MAARYKAPPVCKRRGCDNPRERWQLVCADCWREIPALARDRYSAARRRHLTHIAGKIGREILKALGRKPETPSPETRAYARTAALLGEREVEAAE